MQLNLDDVGDTDALTRARPTQHVRRRRKPLLKLSILVASAVAVTAFGLRQRQPPASLYETVEIGRGDIEDTVSALGKLQPHAYVDVGAQVSGQLTGIFVSPGDRVVAGQLLAEIDPQLQSAKIEADAAESDRLVADLADQQAQLDYAQSEFRRQNLLRSTTAGREDLFQRAQRDMRSAAARINSIKAQLRQIESTLKADRVQLGYTRIYAPMAGTVLSVDARQGQTINATYETPTLLRIADLSTMTVWTQVSEADVTRLHPGMPLYFTTLGYDDRRWDAKLRQILPAPPRPLAANSRDSTSASATLPAPGNVVLYTALFDVENTANALRPDMTAQVFFIAAEANNAAIVPVAALTPDNKTPGHYAVNVVAADQALTTRDVMIGIKTRFSAQILSGLVPGDRIVTGKLNGPDTSSSLLGFQP